MHHAFIKIKSLHGELKRSLKNNGLGITVSTEELVFQQPHVNYHILLEDIVSIIPAQEVDSDRLSFIMRDDEGNEVTQSRIDTTALRMKFNVQKAVIHNRNSRRIVGPISFIMPVHREMLREIAKYANLNAIT